jgi:hypothetical protein
MLVYHSENPRAFKQQKVIRGELGVHWISNHKASEVFLLCREVPE